MLSQDFLLFASSICVFVDSPLGHLGLCVCSFLSSNSLASEGPFVYLTAAQNIRAEKAGWVCNFESSLCFSVGQILFFMILDVTDFGIVLKLACFVPNFVTLNDTIKSRNFNDHGGIKYAGRNRTNHWRMTPTLIASLTGNEKNATASGRSCMGERGNG